MHRNAFGPRNAYTPCRALGSHSRSFAFALFLALLLTAQATSAHAQQGCEYVQTGATAGEFILDCTSHLPPGKMPDPNPDMYLVISLSPNHAVGAAFAPSQPDAERRATAICKQNGGSPCVPATFHNSCVAVAVSNPKKIIAVEEMPGQGWNPSELARHKCEISGGSNCRTIIAACANGYMSPTPWEPPARPDGSYQIPTFRRR